MNWVAVAGNGNVAKKMKANLKKKYECPAPQVLANTERFGLFFLPTLVFAGHYLSIATLPYRQK
jgi:hypothetical protein